MFVILITNVVREIRSSYTCISFPPVENVMVIYECFWAPTFCPSFDLQIDTLIFFFQVSLCSGVFKSAKSSLTAVTLSYFIKLM